MSRSAIYLTIGVMLLLCTSASAEPLNLYQSFPDLSVGEVKIKYVAPTDASPGRLTVVGNPATFDIDGGAIGYNIENGSFRIDAEVSGGKVSGTMEITGDLFDADEYGPPILQDSPLLTGSLSEMGYATSGSSGDYNIFEFLFSTTGGELAKYYSGQGSTIGVILDAVSFPASSAFAGSFDSNFENNGLGNADVFHVPAPPAVVMGAVGLSVVWLSRRFRRPRMSKR